MFYFFKKVKFSLRFGKVGETVGWVKIIKFEFVEVSVMSKNAYCALNGLQLLVK